MYSRELNGHAVGEAFYDGELENELRRYRLQVLPELRQRELHGNGGEESS